MVDGCEATNPGTDHRRRGDSGECDRCQSIQPLRESEGGKDDGPPNERILRGRRRRAGRRRRRKQAGRPRGMARGWRGGRREQGGDVHPRGRGVGRRVVHEDEMLWREEREKTHDGVLQKDVWLPEATSQNNKTTTTKTSRKTPRKEKWTYRDRKGLLGVQKKGERRRKADLPPNRRPTPEPTD